jgi:hypothetical protein
MQLLLLIDAATAAASAIAAGTAAATVAVVPISRGGMPVEYDAQKKAWRQSAISILIDE